MKESVVAEPPVDRHATLADRLLRGGAWVVASRIVGIGLMLLVQILLARRLSPAEFGIFLLLTSVLSLGSVLARFGLDQVIVRFVSESLARGDPEGAGKILKTGVQLGVVSTFVVCLIWIVFLQVFGASLLGFRASGHLLLVTVVGLAVATYMQIVAESFRGFHELRFSSLFYAQNSGPLPNLAFLALLLMIRNVPLSLERAVEFHVISMAVVLPIAMYCLWRTATDRLSTRAWEANRVSRYDSLSTATLSGVCVPVMLTQLLTFTSSQADLWIAGVCCPHDQLALFGAARRLTLMVGLPLDMMNLTVISAIPELYVQGRLGELQRVLQVTAAAAAIPSLLILAVIFFLPATILGATFGPFYRGAATALVILGLGQVVFCFTGSCGNALTMTGSHNFTLIVNLAAVVALLVVGPLAAAHLGINALALVSSSILAGKNIVLWLLARKLVGVWTHASPWRAAVWALRTVRW